MTQLYDVISAQPSVNTGEIRHNQFRSAMAVGKNCHYRINTIAARHFIKRAQDAGMGEKIMASIFEELREATMTAVTNTMAQLPNNSPEEIATAIQSGMDKRLQAIPAN